MKLRKLCFSILAALLTSLSFLPAHAALVTLHDDKFTDITSGTSTNTIGQNAWDGAGRYTVSKVYMAGGAVKLGTSSLNGSMTTTNMSMYAGTLTVEVYVKGWTSDEGDLKISVEGETQVFDYDALMVVDLVTPFEKVTADFQVTAGSHTVIIETTSKRCFLDSILITQDVTSTADAPVFSVNMQSGPTVDELTEVAFTISALVGESPTSVSYVSGVPSGANYSFSNGSFSWMTAQGEAGTYPLIFSAVGGDLQIYSNTVNITVNALTLTAPANLDVSNVKDRTFDASWNPVTAATQGYVVDVWYGSSAIDTPNADVETFFETTDNNPIQPLNWSFTGITGEYMDKGMNEISLDTTDDTIITKQYPRIVTNLAFRIQGRLTSNSVLRVSGSADGIAWTEVGVYTSEVVDSDGNPENNIFTAAGGDLDKNLAFSESLNYRQFKFVYTKDKGNVGIGNIAAVYDGAGTKFISGWQGKTTLSTLESIGGAKPGCPHYIRVGAKNATSTEYSTIRFQTLDAPASTLISLR